ncbi:L-seryl-tRNA(Sec) selenium transferase [Sedimentibacter sp. MB31-C6]|uniref:L-seryl-tRNA(Sec) selenium transferase n=1 Tax=Sedimentibacter sp. MB31-C6 TaxID=3109366 RepID=UPI002DDD1D2D|nr:L-seryl-tRNA(Sec) selenium transferase [Sedimentibacter sp. MB36-C1]WSI04403.1 L-seryl-tRNA(Sec) selenium transferase [Sedimentibacter sp. MB36-C1]
MDKNNYYRSIPKVDILMENEEIRKLSEMYTRDFVLQSVRKATEDLREYIRISESEDEIRKKIDNILEYIKNDLDEYISFNMKKVINGTGTILHTNLGRAVISEDIAEKINKIVTGYSNLEYDLQEGVRGSRYSHFEKIITKITGAEAAMAVNNNAAAVLLILNTFAKDKEVIVSRGELVEIGGSFRVPDVMEHSGVKLFEVGTTNKTHLYDYERAINVDTAALLKVHTSNYQIVGFTESVSLEELIKLGRKYNLPVIEDIGSGVLIDLSKYGLSYEPTVQNSINAGVDIVCFSGDKLLGGPQAGIIVGKKQLIDKLKRNQLTRALRIDKFTAIALECVFREYIDERKAVKNIPVLKMILKSFEEIHQQVKDLYNILNPILGSYCELNIQKCESQIGGGSLPLERLISECLTIKPKSMTTAALEEKLRLQEVPIVGRIVNDYFMLDLRTVTLEDMEIICDTFKKMIVMGEII